MFIYISSQAQVCYTARVSPEKDNHAHAPLTASNQRHWAGDRLSALFTFISIVTCLYASQTNLIHSPVSATSINYGISQQPITDINQLMPKLCQNQSVICEGSFCIPGVRRCVCDLRMPVKFGPYCLRQVDIETKCFVTNQCNHTIKDAVCIDTNSNSILDPESSRFKLDQWQQLNELRQMSASLISPNFKEVSKMMAQSSTQRPMFLTEGIMDSHIFESQDNVIISNVRNSPYEINYNTPELLLQNHTRRRTNHNASRASPDLTNIIDGLKLSDRNSAQIAVQKPSPPSSTTIREPEDITVRPSDEVATSVKIELRLSTQITDRSIDTTTTPPSDILSRRKTILKTPSWPPGVCSCPFGFMFDSMLRKCLALSLMESRCQSNPDCKQIPMTHCSAQAKKCECDEPLVWNQTDLSCQRPRLTSPVPTISDAWQYPHLNKFQFIIISMVQLGMALLDVSVFLLILYIMILIGSLVMLIYVIKYLLCKAWALIAPKQKRPEDIDNGGVPPISSCPYTTLQRPGRQPSSELSDFTQANRGRILNYDFEQEEANAANVNYMSLGHSCRSKAGIASEGMSQTLGRQKAQRDRPQSDQIKNSSATINRNSNSHHHHKKLRKEGETDSMVELNDDISNGQLESDVNQGDNIPLTIPAPPPNQAPPYMLASAMKGQGSAIAAAAAAVANRRMQMAQNRNIEQQGSSRQVNGNPVFL